MPVDNRARGINHRVVQVSTIGEHSVDPRDRAPATPVIAGPFNQLRDQPECRGWVAFHRGRFTQREADLATEVARRTSGVKAVVRVFEYISEQELKQLQAAPAPAKP